MTVIVRLLRAETAFLVNAGIGRAIFDREDPRLGRGIYEYANEEVAITLCEQGLGYSSDGVKRAWLYTDIHDIELMSLTQLVRLKGVNAVATIGVRTADDVFQIRVPYGVYSSIATPLERGVREQGSAR